MYPYQGKATSFFDRLKYRIKDFTVLSFHLCCEAGISEGNKVLDYGSSTGVFAACAAKEVGPQGKVYALEDNPEALLILVDSIANNGYDNVEVLEGIYPTGIESGALDEVVIHNRLSYLEDPAKALGESYRVLNTGGVLSICDDKLSDEQVMKLAKDNRFDFADKLEHSLLFMKMFEDDDESGSDLMGMEDSRDSGRGERIISTGKIEVD
jgi:ubiquinone/menaquinone biosynthesis C-methylase UbiE